MWTLLWLPGIASGAGTVSIADVNGFGQARSCVVEAFHLWGWGGLWNGALQCPNNGGYQDSCVCRCDLRTIGESYISSYVKSACSSNNVDIQSGLLLYDVYCDSVLPAPCSGYTPVPVQVTLPTKAPGAVSIWSMDGFASARSCMTEAFHAWGSGGLWNGALLCNSGNGGYLNECVCRADLLSIGESYISSFVNSACSSNTADIQSGLSMYDNYCATAYPKAAQITSVGTGVIQLGTATSMLFTPTKTGSSSTSNSARTTEALTSSIGSQTPIDSSGGAGQFQELTRSDVIALGVGIGVGLPATIASLVVCWYTIRERGHRRPA